MSAPCPPPTLDTLCLRIAHLEELLNVHRAYQQKELETADKVLHIKLQEMNNFREENKDLTAKFVTREWFDKIHGDLVERIEYLELNRSNFDGRLIGIGGVLGIVFLVIELAAHWWKP